MSAKETTQLLDTTAVASGAAIGAAALNDAATKVKKARMEGPLSYRILAFLGGLAMIFSNGIAILDRFFSFNFTGSLIAIYGVIFGIIIAILEGGWSCPTRIQSAIRFYAKFLEFTWGRGMLYFFVGSLQISNWNMLDWAVGGFMIFVGVTAVTVGIVTSFKLKELRNRVRTDAELRKQWELADANKNGTLDIKEMSAFVENCGIEMTRNQIAAAFDALDKNFDEKIQYEEFYLWWSEGNTFSGSRNFAV
eukprot:CAMPEP_0185729832 /NCGR_PEP_ID=MMETSP1171-20130828/7470_1 /TAXON_ID=374046 /ORGANISM="Helicotheca tamensis, Strain CCMP826" /LENGTH=249 /DNA_ID=CAMNT_0028398757 /DNA_START=91 /DNA_END=840 /DNA_ORIENTATION=-